MHARNVRRRASVVIPDTGVTGVLAERAPGWYDEGHPVPDRRGGIRPRGRTFETKRPCKGSISA